LSLDATFFKPGWTPTPNDEFVAKVRAFLDESERNEGGWIVDGNWMNKLGDAVQARATDIICELHFFLHAAMKPLHE
jgi:hypothetical protein